MEGYYFRIDGTTDNYAKRVYKLCTFFSWDIDRWGWQVGDDRNQ